MMLRLLSLSFALLCVSYVSGAYYGKHIGELQGFSHGVKGKVYAASSRSLYLCGFSYDGRAQDARFKAGSSPELGKDAFIIPHSYLRIPPYHNESFLLRLPQNKRVQDIRWFSIASETANSTYGYLTFPAKVDVPQPKTLTSFSRFAHDVRSDAVIIKDSKTIYIPGLYYDGKGPDAFFLVGKGPVVTHVNAIKVPNETGGLRLTKPYNNDNITLTLPGELTFDDIDWITIYCIKFRHNFGQVLIPKNLNVPVYGA